ncbi:MAG: hypothetical protein PHR35_10855 [Kiritimatiellae bacterium]|nr:hypothetical protein [Kiritimatiellia bacterium]
MEKKSKTLRDHFWLWGQNAGSHHDMFGKSPYALPGVNRMEAAEGGAFFGIPNCCRVSMFCGPVPPFDAESEKLKTFKQVVWSAVGAAEVARHNSGDHSDLAEVLRQADKFPNVTGAILDDFFLPEETRKATGRIARHSVESIATMRASLHRFKRPLDLWMVWYDYQLQFDVDAYLELCDVVTLWTWKGSALAALDQNLETFVKRTPGKRRLAGCYMWNYGERQPLTMAQMKGQLDRYYQAIHEGVIEGIVFCSNCIADIGLDTVEWTRRWIANVGNETTGVTDKTRVI